MKKRIRRVFSGFERIRESRAVKWLGPWLHDPRVWHVSREGIARGAAIGIFIGLVIPIGQIPATAILAIALHANLPVAAASTLITNPFTVAPIYYLGYRIGAWMLGIPPAGAVEASFDIEPIELTGWFDIWWHWVTTVGKPLFLGLFSIAVASSSATYALINWTWRLATLRAWQRRHETRNNPSTE